MRAVSAGCFRYDSPPRSACGSRCRRHLSLRPTLRATGVSLRYRFLYRTIVRASQGLGGDAHPFDKRMLCGCGPRLRDHEQSSASRAPDRSCRSLTMERQRGCISLATSIPTARENRGCFRFQTPAPACGYGSHRDDSEPTRQPVMAHALSGRAHRASCESRRPLQGTILGRTIQVSIALRRPRVACCNGVCRSEPDPRGHH